MKDKRRLSVLLIAFLILASTSSAASQPDVAPRFWLPLVLAGYPMPVEQYALVTRVIDGDTVELETDQQKVRYIGINAPEIADCYGPEAAQMNRELDEDIPFREHV